MGRKLYVGNLPYQTDEAALTELFAKAGTVDTVSVVRDMATGRARGFAFVEMGSDEEAQAAISQINGVDLGGRALTVNEARPKMSGGGGGYDGGGDSRRRSEPRW
jgi:RNA recognition motif-containing protein